MPINVVYPFLMISIEGYHTMLHWEVESFDKESYLSLYDKFPHRLSK